jgi:CRP/FNR family transcriptional regulator, anaerobic regulatory protein
MVAAAAGMVAARAAPAAGCGVRPGCETCEVRVLATCRAVGVEGLARLAAAGTCRRIEAGQALFGEGEPAEAVYTLTAGMLKLYKLMSDGRRQVVGFLIPGDFLGLAFGRGYAYTAEAVTPVAACRFGRARFMGLLEEFPALEKEVLTRTSSDLAAAQDQMLLLGRKTARERVASFLRRHAERERRAALVCGYEEGEGEGRAIGLPMGRADIADHLGLTIETVSRTLTSLRKEGIIELPAAHEVVVRNPAGLARAAGR